MRNVKWLPDETASPYDETPQTTLADMTVVIGKWLDRLGYIWNAQLVGCPACEYTMHPTPDRLRGLQTMPYRDYLWTREWRQTRRGALHRAAYRCQLCDDRAAVLHVHHNTYQRRGHEWPTDLAVLCEDCHGRHHGR